MSLFVSQFPPIEILNELIEANSLKQKDLVDVFGTPSIVSEVLKGKRGLTIEHIKKLSRKANKKGGLCGRLSL